MYSLYHDRSLVNELPGTLLSVIIRSHGAMTSDLTADADQED